MHISTSVPNLLLLCKKAILQTRLLLTLALIWISAAVMGQTTETFTTTGTNTWVCPPGVTSIDIECWGAGGGGGGAKLASSASASGGGGAGGGYVKRTSYTVTPGTSYTIYVGNGGPAGSNTGTDGSDGEASYFIDATTIMAVGGNGGKKSTTASGNGAGGAAKSTGNVGFSSTFSYYGGSGGTGSSACSGGYFAGGGGASAGTVASTSAQNGACKTGGTAPTGGVNGADAGWSSSGNGSDGSTKGSGGSGAKVNSITGYAGGKGGDGQVNITYTTPSYTTVTFNTAGSGSWVVPCGVNLLLVEAWGSGGGGGGGSTVGNGGSGGGGGAYSKSTLSVTPGTYYYSVGTAGTGGNVGTSTTPQPGGDAWFNSTNGVPSSTAGVLAKGGAAGTNNTTGSGGSGGSVASGYGQVTYSGGNGGAGGADGGGGGGSSAGTATGGANGTSAASGGAGATAPTGGGSGGAGKSAGSSVALGSGDPGSTPGGGGGGSDDNTTRNGGAGAVGQVVIKYIATTTPTAAVISSPANLGTNIGATGTTLNWTNGGGAATYNVFFGTTNPPTTQVGTNQAGTSYDPGTLSFNQTYYWRVDAVDASGCNTTTGSVWSFTTSAGACSANPTITTTTAASSIGATTASSGGSTITAGTNCSITEKGVAYGTSENPTISGTKTSNGTGPDNFSSSLTELTAATLYYARAYVSNSFGTAYGNQISFRTLSAELSGHPASFSAAANGSSQIDLSFSAASSISASGYLIIQKQGSNPGFTPVDATAYTLGATVATGETVAAIITNTAATSTSILGLTLSTAYNFSIIPFTYDGTNTATYNYYTTASVAVPLGFRVANATTAASSTRYAVANDNWNKTSTWSSTSGGSGGASIPGAADNVVIENGRTVTLTENTSCKTITFNADNTLNNGLIINNGVTLTLAGDITINGTNADRNTTIQGQTSGADGTAVLTGIANINIDDNPAASGSSKTLTVIMQDVNISVTSNVRLRSYISSSVARNKTLSLRSGTLTVGGSIVLTSATGCTNTFTTTGGTQTGKLVFTGTTPWAFTSDFAPSTVTLTGTGSTVEYSGAGAQDIEPFNYNNLVSSNLGSRTLGTSSSAPRTGSIGIAGSFTPGSNSYIVTGSTVNFNGTDQTIPAFTFSSLTVSNSGTKTLGGNVSLTGTGSLTVSAGTLDLSSFTCNRSTSGGTLTLAASTTLKIGGTNTLPSNYSTHSINASSTVEYAGTTQSVATLNSSQNYGNLVISGSGTKTLGGTVGVAGNLTVSAGTFDLSTFTCNRSAAGGTLSLAASTSLKIGGTNSFPSNYSTHSINSSSTVEYAGTTQSVATLNSSQNYGNLIISGSGTKTLGGNVGVAGNLTVSAGTLDLSTFTCNRSSAGGTLSLASSTALKIGGTNSFPTNYSTHSINSSSTVEYAGTTQSVATLNSSQNYGNLIISGSGTKTLAGNVGVAGNLTVGAGTFDLSTFTCNRSSAGGTLSLAASTTLKIGGTNSFPTNYSTHSINSTSTVEYAGTTQSVAALNSSQNYGNLIISGSGTKTLAGNATVAGDLTLTAGTFADGGNTLTLQGNLAGTGTHTSTGSGEILMNGSSRTISGATLGNLELNNSGGFSLSGSPTVSGTLALTSGVVTTSLNTLTIGVNGSVSGASSSNYISGKLAWVFPSSGTNIARTFPVGKGGNYRPATFTYATAASQTVTLEHFASGTPLSFTNTSRARFGLGYWNINQSVNGTYTIGLNNGGVTPTGTVVMLRREGTGSVTSNATSFSSPTYTNTSAFSTSIASNDVMLAETSIPLTITGVTASNKTYDGNTDATLSVGSAALSGVVSPDDVTLTTSSATGAFGDKNVGTGKTVTTSGFGLLGANAGAYSLTQPSTTANITAKGLTASLTGTVSKTYDGSPTATLTTANYSLTGVETGDVVTVTNTSGTYDSKNVGTSKTVTVSSPLTLSGTDAGNYSISGNATGAVGTITARALTITGASNSKTYDGGTSSATVPAITSGALQGSDEAAFTQTYDNKNVGTSKVMTPSGVVTDGNSGNNYSYTFVTSSNGTITAKGLTASLTGTVSKTYDGTTIATLTTSNYNITGVVSGDVVTVTNTSGSYDNKNVGTSKTVTVSSPLTLGGAAAGNYSISGNATGTVGAITAKALTASLTGTVTKTYDANTTATLTSANYSLTGVVGSEEVTVTNTSGTYNNKDVGTGKTVTVTSLVLGGADKDNYSISGNATGSIGAITKKELTITANDQSVAFGTAVATVTNAGSYTATGFITGETASVISGTATYTTNYTNITAVGTPGVTITPVVTGLTATNYSFTPANGTITIIASSKTWVGQGLDKTGNWNVAGHWSPSGVPNSSLHSIVIDEGTPTLDINYTVVSGKTLTISGTGALIIGAGRTLTIAGVADFGNRPVTLKSTSAGTASIGTISGTLSNATAVTVERYMLARRKWRALTAPLTGNSNNSIHYNWQNNGSPTGSTGAIIWRNVAPLGSEDATTGLWGGGASASMLSLNTSTNTWTQVSSTKASESLFTPTENKAYMLFFTGPYNKSGTYVTSGTLASTLSATGTLRTGNVVLSSLATGWHMIGNPYASSVNIGNVAKSGLNAGGYIWNPGGAGTGVFTPITLSTGVTIQSGQAFFVYSEAGAGSLTFEEADKVSSSSNSVFRTEENSYDGDLKIELNKYVTGTPELSDVAIVNYKSRSDAGLPKLAQFFENMSIYQDNLDYGLTTRTLTNGEDNIQLRMWQMNEANYQLNIDLSSMKLPNGSVAVLKDAFLNKEIALSTTEANKIDFNVTSNAASTGQRFSVSLRSGATTPVTNLNGEKGFSVYPNPLVRGGNIQLELRNKAAGKYTVTLFTIAGVRVQQDIIGHAGGTAVQSLKLSNLASGAYIAEISGGNSASEKVKVVIE